MLQLLTRLKHRDFRRLFFAQIISQFGDRIHQMALIGLIAERADSGTSAMSLAKLLSFTIIPVFIVGPIAGVFVDRWSRRDTLFICDFFRGVLVLFIPLVFIRWFHLVPIYIIVFLAFCLSRFYVPAKMSIIPDLVEEGLLLKANSLISVTGMIAFVFGAAVGGFLVDHYGARTGFFIDAATFFVSGLLIFRMSSTFKARVSKERVREVVQEMKEIEKSVWHEAKEGFHYLMNHKDIRFVINMLFVLLGAAGAVYVVIIVFIQQSFHSVTKDLGVLAVFLGLGLFAGAMAYGKWGQRFAWHKTIFFCLALGGAMINLFAFVTASYPNLIIASCMSAGLGFVIGPVFIAANTVTHLVSDEKMRGKVFTALEIVIHLAFLVMMFVSSFLSEYIGAVWILMGVGLVTTLVGVLGLVRFRGGTELAKT